MIYVGIDPGLSGAMGVLDESGDFLLVSDPPVAVVVVTRNRKKKDAEGTVVGKRQVEGEKRVIVPNGLFRLLKELTGVRMAAIEKVGTRPKESPIGAFSFGFGCGLWHMALVALEIPSLNPTPQEWKTPLKLPKDKEAVRLRALARWPKAASFLALKKHEGRAEALFLAEYARQNAPRPVRRAL